jgi:predicted phage terminase large subunit-like protein
LHFTSYTFPAYRADPVHALIAATLDRVVAGEIQRLMIFAPPQHGKSELVSVRLPAYWLARRPDDPLILASYGADLAYNHSGQARQVLEGAEFATLFPGIRTRRDSRAVNHWRLAGQRGGLLAVGVGGPITGHGARLGIIDDPFENWEQAQSETWRARVWEWYRTTFRTRIWEQGAIILIMTRWHEDDLAGRLLHEHAGQYTVLRLPALAESQAERDANNARLGLGAGDADPLARAPGDPLAPSRFSQAALASLRNDVGGLGWAAEYQGVPTALEGTLFRRQWLPIVDAAPAAARRVRYWDKGGTEGGGDFSVGTLMNRSPEGVFIVENVVRGQWSSHQRNEVMAQTAQLDGQRPTPVTIWVEQEGGSGGKESAEATVRLLAGYNVHTETVTGSKTTRAQPFAAQCEAGNVRLLRGDWNAAYLDELTSFPFGRHDDQVDASSGAFAKLAQRIDTAAILEAFSYLG